MNFVSKMIGAAIMMVSMVASVSAQDVKLSIDPVTIAPGEEAEVVINYEGTKPWANIQFDFTLPEGLSFVKQEVINADEEVELAYGVKGTALYSSHDLLSAFQGDQNNVIRFLIMHTQNKGIKNSGTLFSFKVKADETLAESSEIKVSTIEFSGMENGELIIENPADFTIAVTKGTPTGINGIEANSEKAAGFNLAGQKVSANAKGIRIQNGKKVVVK